MDEGKEERIREMIEGCLKAHHKAVVAQTIEDTMKVGRRLAKGIGLALEKRGWRAEYVMGDPNWVGVVASAVEARAAEAKVVVGRATARPACHWTPLRMASQALELHCLKPTSLARKLSLRAVITAWC